MTPIVKHGKHMSQLNVAPIYDNTDITLKNNGHATLVYQNDALVAWLTFPVMKIVRGIRKMYPTVKINLI